METKLKTFSEIREMKFKNTDERQIPRNDWRTSKIKLKKYKKSIYKD